MKTATSIRAGRWSRDNGSVIELNHNESMKLRSSVKAGGRSLNHNASMRVQSNLKAGTKSVNRPLAYSVKDVSL
jgi:hypothetical protein